MTKNQINDWVTKKKTFSIVPKFIIIIVDGPESFVLFTELYLRYI